MTWNRKEEFKDRQSFEDEITGYLNMVNKFKEAGDLKKMDDNLEHILALKEHLEHARYKAEKVREKEVLLGWDPSDFEKLTEAIDRLQPYDDLWELVYRWTSEEKKWMRGPLFSLEPEAVDALANSLAKRAMKLQGFFESQNLQAPVFVAKKIKKDADAFKQHLPLIHALCNPGLRPRHWEEISEVVHFQMERDAAFTLSRVVDMDVGNHLTALQEISDSASREYGLEKTLESIYEQWQPVAFELKPWKDTETYIVAGSTVDEMQSLMDDHIIKVQTMKGSPYAKAFMKKITSLESWLLQTQEIMDIWMKVQGVWLYLEPIFSSEDIVKQMPTEATIFKQVDMDWRATMAAALEAGKAMEATKEEGLLEMLQKCNANLEVVQKGLNDYLEMKRLAFPRFFFLSNDNLLEILSETWTNEIAESPRRLVFRMPSPAAMISSDGGAKDAVAASWQEILANNASDMLKSSDEPAALLETLQQMLKAGGGQHKVATTVLHIGWREAMSNKTNQWINMGVVAALVFSVLFSAINQPFGTTTADDMWAEHRVNMNKVLICLLYISTIFGLITVVLTILLLIHMASFVNDADDFLFFVKLNPSGLVDISIIICLLCGGISIPLAAVVGNEEPIASICFFTGIFTFTGVLVIYVRSLVYNQKRVTARMKSLSGHQEAMQQILRQEFEKINAKGT
eukprot:s839_g10.t1